MSLREKCKARSDCTNVHSDLALHSSQNESMVSNGRIRMKQIIYHNPDYHSETF